ncbi:MAG: sulfotransferase family protein [Thermodesulfobacteriota bacterium]
MKEEFMRRFNRSVKVNMVRDAFGVALLRLKPSLWPCMDKKYLVVGCESSGTTVISHLLLINKGARFLYEGYNIWVRDLYKSVYQGKSHVRDYPRLQLYDRMKIPGFASILPEFVAEFPNTDTVYILRDPRDMIASAFKSFKVVTREDRDKIRWAKETWIDITGDDPVERMAHRWKLYLARCEPVKGVRFVRYEDFCADKEGFIKKLGSQLGIEIDTERLNQKKNAQASDEDARAYKPRGPGAWKELLEKDDVSKIEKICGDYMRKWGYL